MAPSKSYNRKQYAKRSRGRYKSSNSSLQCPGCKEMFPNIANTQGLIKYHMLKSRICSKILKRCNGCWKYFFNEADLQMHLSIESNISCKMKSNDFNEASKFQTTQVVIPDNVFASDNDDDNTQLCSFIEDPNISTPDLELIHRQATTACTKSVGSKVWKVMKSEVSCKVQAQNIEYLDDEIDESLEECEKDSGPEDDGTNVEDILQFNIDLLTGDNLNMNNADERYDDSHISSNDQSSTEDCYSVDLSTSEFCPENVLLDMKKHQQEESNQSSYDHEYITCLELVKILIDKGISLSHYDVFMKWKNSSTVGPKKFISLDKLISISIERTYGESLAQRMKPIIHMVDLQSGRKCHLVTFDVATRIFDMLNNKSLTKPENLIFKEKDGNPFHVFHSEDFNDIETSSVYIKTCRDERINNDEEILCPIGLYIDELKLDAFGKLGLEPVVMTLLIYNRQTRNTHEAHRVIGYMPNFSMLFGSKSYSADDKANDYHQCLSLIIDNIKKIQCRNGYRWRFEFQKYPNQVFERKLKFPLFYVIGDAKGNDLLAGRYGSRHKTTCVARDCDILTNLCDDPKQVCNFHRQDIMETKDINELKDLSFRKLNKNAFEGIWFGSQPYGLFAALPPEPLHVFLLGIVERLSESFLHRLTPQLMKTLDAHVGYICSNNCRQSDREYPTLTTFTSGVSNATRLTAKEKLARIFAIYLTLLTKDFQDEIVDHSGRTIIPKKMEGKISRTEYNHWINVFEQTLLFSSWIYREHHPKAFFNGGRKSPVAQRIVEFMLYYRKHAPRKDGNGLKLLKFHHLLHFWWVIRLFGSLLNIDGSRGESNNQFLAKRVGKETQQNHLTLNYQTGLKSFSRDLFLNAIQTNLAEDLTTGRKKTSLYDRMGTGSKFKIVFDYEKDLGTCSWTGWKMKRRRCNFLPHILQSVYFKLKDYNGGIINRRIKSISGFTELVMKDDDDEHFIVRACPMFRSSRHWHDWINIQWKDGNDVQLLPAQVLMFLETSTIEFEDYTPNETQVVHTPIESEKIAFVHSVNGNKCSKTMPAGKSGGGFHSQIASWSKMESEYQMVSVDTFDSKCFIIVDTLQDDNENYSAGMSTRIINILPRDEWSTKFIDYSKGNDNFILDENVTTPILKFYEH